MNPTRRTLAALATLAGTLLAFTAAAPAALAIRVPPPGGNAWPVSGVTRSVPWPKTSTAPAPPQVHTIVVGGMPGWQITLIAAGAAVVAAVIAIMLDRVRTTRQRATASTA